MPLHKVAMATTSLFSWLASPWSRLHSQTCATRQVEVVERRDESEVSRGKREGHLIQGQSTNYKSSFGLTYLPNLNGPRLWETRVNSSGTLWETRVRRSISQEITRNTYVHHGKWHVGLETQNKSKNSCANLFFVCELLYLLCHNREIIKAAWSM